MSRRFSRRATRFAVEGGAIDPAHVAGTTLWWDERSFAPDGSAATTIEKNDSGARSYAKILSVAPGTPERSRYFGQPYLAMRPSIVLVRGWRAPSFVHDNSGGGIGRSLRQENYNTVNTIKMGTIDSFIAAGSTKYQIYATVQIPNPATMAADEGHGILSSQGSTLSLYLNLSGGTLSAKLLHQGPVSGNVTVTVDLTAAGVASGDCVTLCGWWDGTNLNLEALMSSGAFVVATPAPVDGLGAAQTAFRTQLGGLNGGSSCYSGPIFASGIVAGRTQDISERRAQMRALSAKYKSTTTQTFPDGAVAQDPATIQPSHLTVVPGTFTVGGGLVSRIANPGSAADFIAAGAQRPTKSTIGTLDSFSPDGAGTWLDMESGTEADVISLTAFTVLGVVNIKASDQTPAAVQNGPCLLTCATALAAGVTYQGGDGLSRGPGPYTPCTAGPHGGFQIATMIEALGDGTTTRTVVYCNILDPSMNAGDSSTAIIRAAAGGAQQTDWASTIVAAFNGAVLAGKRSTSLIKCDQTLPYVWNVALSYPEYQAAERFLALAAGLAT